MSTQTASNISRFFTATKALADLRENPSWVIVDAGEGRYQAIPEQYRLDVSYTGSRKAANYTAVRNAAKREQEVIAKEAKELAESGAVICDANHGGCHSLTWNVRAFECAGCLAHYTVEEVLSATRHAAANRGGVRLS